MPDAIIIAQFERRLVEMGCPSRRLAEHVHELAEHYEDLKQAALDEGLPEKEAEAQASSKLGDPILLAENAAALLRQSSWWGRHPIVGFCVLPLPVFILAWGLCTATFGGLCWLLGKMFGPAYTLDDATQDTFKNNPDLFNTFTFTTNVVLSLCTIQIVVFVLCRLANRGAAGLKWMLVACVSCALVSLVNRSEIQPRLVTFGLAWPPQHWFYALPPLITAVLLFIYQSRKQGRLAPISAKHRSKGSLPAARKIRWYTTPTFWITTVLLLSLFAVAFKPFAYAFNGEFNLKDVSARVWPVERADTLAYLKVRQSVAPPANEATINLKPYVNATLADSIDDANNAKGNNLAALPVGIHTFGGVSFDVEGRIQLAGGDLIKPDKRFPTRVKLPVSFNFKCSRLYLLQGADNVNTGDKIAWLVLHYKDGSQAQLEIIGGQDVLDCWGPIYNTNSGDDRYPTSPHTELAWAGSNPDIEKESPDYSLRLYRTTFTNPHPELEISSIDYVSSLTGASPFLAGLSIEKL